MERIRVILVGQPNVGKSSLLNCLVGPKVTVSNYPGTTVELTKARKKIGNREIEFIDTPGIYSISDRSEEEKVTEKALFDGNIDIAIVVADAVAIERSLYIVFQIMEAEIPMIIALNFVEEADRKGIKIDYHGLEKILNTPVVPVNPLTAKGINKLFDIIVSMQQIGKQGFRCEYDDHIEKAINFISSQVKSTLPGRFVALRILEEDEDFYKYFKNREMIHKIDEDLEKNHPRIAEDISITRYGTASFIAEKVTRMASPRRKQKLEDTVDRILLHQNFGPLITLLFFVLLFGALFKMGQFTQEILMSFAEELIFRLSAMGSTLFGMILIQGFSGLTAGISIALPYVFLFYLFLGLLEDTGLLSRFVVNTDRFLKKLGLPGKSFIPLMLGLGCTAPATRATRVLSNEKDQFQTASLYIFIPCSSRIAIIMGIVGFYGGFLWSFYLFATLLFASLIWTFGVKKILKKKSEPLLLELPTYRKPLLKNVLVKSWIRMKDFVYVVIPLLALGGIVFGILEMFDLTDIIIEPLSPITRWLGLPAPAIIPLVFGFLQKDLTGSMLISVLGRDISLVLTPLQIYTFGTVSCIGIPCIIALGMFIKEFGIRKVAGLFVASTIYSLVLAGLIWRGLAIFY
ncbi:MAG: ferrous iron transport protein B [Candidatus Atribacteria bacterium]|nr:ferrous iron transport protein B [Candidatus Atribacteria bacterium]